MLSPNLLPHRVLYNLITSGSIEPSSMSNYESVQDISEIKKVLITTKATQINDKISFLHLFQVLSDALVAKDDVQKSSIVTIDTLTIWFLRANQYSKALGITFNDSEVPVTSLTQVARFVFDYFESGSGALSNAMTSLLSRLCQFTNNMQGIDSRNVYGTWLKLIMAMPKTLKSFFVILEAIIKESESIAKQLLETYHDFPRDCINMLEYNALANVSSKTFTIVHSKTYGSGVKFMESWKVLVIEGLQRKETRDNITNTLLQMLFRQCPNHYLEFLKEIRNLHDDEIFLCVAKVGHKIVPNFEEVDDFDQILNALSSSDSNKRLDAFEVIVGCMKSTKLTADNILLAIMSPLCLEVFSRESNSPQLRNRYLTLMQRAILTLRDYISNCEKHVQKQLDVQPARCEIEHTVGALKQIHDYFGRQMVPTSSYCLLILAADILQIFIVHGFDGIQRSTKRQQKQCSKLFDIYTPVFIQNLLRMSSNNYEDIRTRASFLLRFCPYHLLDQSLPHPQDVYIRNTIRLLHSLKGRQSDCTAEVIFTLAQIYVKNDVNKFEHLLDCLVEELKEIDLSLIDFQSPHGLFTAFARILSSTDVQISLTRVMHQNLLDFLRLKLSESWNSIKKGMLDTSIAQNEYMNDKWRVLKESSQLTRVLVELSSRCLDFSLNADDFESLSWNLVEQLTLVSHRGAFSAIQLNFVEVCKTYIAQGEGCKLEKWLQQNLSLLRSHTQLISRRSGGLPYLITAILNGMSSDPQLTEECIKYTFKELLSIASQEYSFDGTEIMDIPQVHAYNCMKHIVGEIQNSTVDEFISAALEISFQNLDHESWSMKNAAVMTFTSLQLRIFGSNQMGDVLPRMNAPLFFLKYPGVSQILLDKLENSHDKVNVIIPVLSILSRLASHKPDDERVAVFLDVLNSKFLGHRVWKVREMSSSVIASLYHSSKISEMAMNLADRILEMSSYNKIHGALLCIANILRNFTADDKDRLCDIVVKMTDFFDLLSKAKSPNWTLISACTKVLSVSPHDRTELLVNDFLIRSLENPPDFPDATRRLCLRDCAKLVISEGMIKKNFSSIVKNSVYAFSLSDEYEVVFTFLDFWDSLPVDSELKVTEVAESVQGLAQRLLKNDGWTYLIAKVLNFLVKNDLPLHNAELLTLDDKYSQVAVPVWFLQLKNSDKLETDLAIRYSASDQDEETRITSVLAAKFILENSDNAQVKAGAAFLLFQKLSDASSDVREASRIALSKHLSLKSSSVVTTSQQFVPYFIQNFGSLRCKVVSAELNSIEQNLNDASRDLQSIDFEVESDNLYMDEILYHKQVVSMLRVSDENYPNVIAQCVKHIENVLDRVSSDLEPIITTWTFNFHLHAAIGKAFNYRLLKDDLKIIYKSLVKLAQKLEEIGYPLFDAD